MKARRTLLGLVAVGSLFGVTMSRQQAGRYRANLDAAQAQAGASDAFRCVWAQPIPDFRAAALSSDGNAVAAIGEDGRVRLWDWKNRPGRPLWSRTVPGASQITVSSGAHTVLAYSPLDPTQKTVTFLGTAGNVLARSTLDGAVWDVGCSDDGNYAGVSTGSRSLYLFTLSPHPALHRWQIGGIGNSLALTRDGSTLTAGTWDNSGVACYTARGVPLWQYPVNPAARPALTDRLFTAQIARNGNCVLGLSYANVRDGDGTLYYWRGPGSGRPVWSHALGQDAYYPQARISADGGCVAVTYTRLITHGEQAVTERRLLVLDDAGNTLWEKGSLLFSPTLVSVAADGHRVTVSNGPNTLYDLDEQGRLSAPYRFAGTIRATVGSPDGRWLLVYTGDGLLNLMKLG